MERRAQTIRSSVVEREKTSLLPDVGLNRAFGEAPAVLVGREQWKQLDADVRRRIRHDDDAFRPAHQGFASPPQDVWTTVARKGEAVSRLSRGPGLLPPPPAQPAEQQEDAPEPDDDTYTDSEPESDTQETAFFALQ